MEFELPRVTLTPSVILHLTLQIGYQSLMVLALQYY